MKLIELHSKKYPGLFTQVNDEDYEWLSKYRWNVFNNHGRSFYARTSLSYQTPILMHRMILSNCKKQIDHKDRNGLNNQRNNLRPATYSLNAGNQRKNQGIWTSQYKGVHWNKKSQKWQAVIHKNNKQINLGRFTDEINAAKAYDKKAKELFGEYACLNF